MNFEFLRESRADLAALGGFAEHYAFNDPSGALIKLRQFTERVVDLVYEVYRLPKPYQANLIDLLNETCLREQIPDVILAKLHTLRIQGNKAAHSSQGSTQMALAMVREAFDISCWVWLAFCNGKRDELPTYTDPKPPIDAKKLEADRSRLFKQIAEQEALVQSLLEELELTKGAKIQAERTAEELQQLTSHSQTVADELKFNETTTRRRLIDTQLVAAGWRVEDNTKSNDEVGQEVEVTQEFLDGGKGWADYVLWGEDGKPLAVVEAKKTAKDAQVGRQQAKLYADGLEKDYGQRPVIFYTNGFDLFIWDDAQKQTPRRLFGFYSKKSLQYLIYQRAGKLVLGNIPPKLEIADRMYQLETVKRVCERFSTGHRKALIVLATGTGKTRVAASLCDVLQRGQWAKRILFLCDRRELRKQANDVFKEHLSGSPRIILDGKTAGEDTARIYLATYPAMLRQYEHFDTGFFDLIIADESHRSIYNRYRDIFLYFDALQVGLTATPVHFIARNTFSLFNCENGDPTAAYTYEDAIAHTPPYLVPFEVVTHTTEFLRRGIKYQELSAEQRQQLEEDQPDAEDIDFEAPEVDKVVFNKDTNRIILRNLMENGIREATGAHPGKTIIFARNHRHAILLGELFDEMYPQYGGEFCRVIDNYDPRAEQLIDNFKDPKHPLTIAVSVDMLDTGIDVPEVVNLVFAKPVKSFVKFWQMIGRGTRLCQNLFGPGKDKTSFSIFDHWGNFEFFEQTYVEAEPAVSKSLLQRLFEMRIDLADIAYSKQHVDAFDLAIKLLKQDLAELPENTIAVREKWKAVRECQREGLLQTYAPATRVVLVNDMALLMQWRDTRGQEDAYSFDLLLAQIQSAFIQESSYFDDLKMQLLQVVSELPINVNAVRDKIDTINAVKDGEFWSGLSVASLEHVRTELRGIMRYRVRPLIGGFEPRLIDVKEDASKIETNRHVPKLAGLELAAYRQRVEEALKQLFDTNHVIRKIRRAEPVSKTDLDSLVSLVLTDHPDINLSVLTEFYPDSAGDLAAALRSIVGLEAEVVATAFSGFVATHPMLNAKQQRFLALLQNHIAKYGAISIEKLYEAPFIQVDADGLDGVFESQDAEALIGLIQRFRPQSPATA